MKRSIAWGIGITLAAAAFAGACGNSVSDTSGSGGKGTGGQGTPASSSQATTGGTGGSGGTVGTGGSGGSGDACTKACAHAAGCNQDICSLLPAAADCSTQEGMCLAACINGANCQEITDAVNWATMGMMGAPPSVIICAAPCLQGGTGGGGQGGNGAGGGGSMACQNCAVNACQGQIGTCAGDAACMGWFNCAMGCGFNDDACLTMCDQNNPSASADAIYACACTSCATECSQIDPCNHHTGGASSSASTGP